MKTYKKLVLASCIAAIQMGTSTAALAVGGGLEFTVDESQIVSPGAIPPEDHLVKADSMDFTYHACTHIGGPNNDRLRELGYFWISSYQNIESVVDSQINYFQAEGYHIYAQYQYQATQVGVAQGSISGNRMNYLVSPLNAAIQLYVDPLQDTQLEIQDCQVIISGNADDTILGNAATVAQGDKSETDGLANGDFKVVFSNWHWSPAVNIFNADDFIYSLEDFNYLIFNGNITTLGGALGVNHNPEGSGNLFWKYDFQAVDTTSEDESVLEILQKEVGNLDIDSLEELSINMVSRTPEVDFGVSAAPTLPAHAAHPFIQIFYDSANATAMGAFCSVGNVLDMDKGRMEYHLVVDQAIIDDMNDAIAQGGYPVIEFDTIGSLNLVGGGSVEYSAFVRTRVLHIAGGQTRFDRSVELASESTPGVHSQQYNYLVELTQNEVNQIAVGDTIEVTVLAVARADSGGCDTFDAATVTYAFDNSAVGKPDLLIRY